MVHTILSQCQRYLHYMHSPLRRSEYARVYMRTLAHPAHTRAPRAPHPSHTHATHTTPRTQHHHTHILAHSPPCTPFGTSEAKVKVCMCTCARVGAECASGVRTAECASGMCAECASGGRVRAWAWCARGVWWRRGGVRAWWYTPLVSSNPVTVIAEVDLLLCDAMSLATHGLAYDSVHERPRSVVEQQSNARTLRDARRYGMH